MAYKKISYNCPAELYGQLEAFMKKKPALNQTDALNLLVADGLVFQDEVNQYRHLYELVNLKILFFLREIAATRGEDFVTDCDAKFDKELPELKAMILEKGIDYVGR